MTERYSKGAIILHWLISICIITAILIAEITEDWEGPARGTAMMLHKSFGISILFLSVVRVIWRLTHRPPAMDAHLKVWEKGLAHFAHTIFYVLMIGMPISGWIMSSAPAEPYPLTFFGLFDIPYLPVQGNKAAGEAAHDGHELAGKVMIAVILLHIAGALKHQFFDKRPSLSRMGIGR
jgi:cytochrome b561